ncbi:MAG: hypothetical protein QNJ54_32650 [Prochloraceae cyanobacterium]|nr:hypothetical protein [Prochloraceae cyanobacterium]
MASSTFSGVILVVNKNRDKTISLTSERGERKILGELGNELGDNQRLKQIN